jgi:predicted nucleic acid-binding protein
LTLIVDSGGLLAALDSRQKNHADFVGAVQNARGPLLISPFVLAELDYMIGHHYGRDDQLAFLDEVDRGAYRLEEFAGKDFSRAKQSVGEYPYLSGFGIADASNVVLAERYGVFDILTTDQRDFREVAGSGGRYFRILPYDS